MSRQPQNDPDDFLAATKAEPRTPASPLGGLTRLGRGGYFFVATPEEAERLNPAVGPASLDSPYPHLYEPTLLAEIARAALASAAFSEMDIIASEGGATIYLFPPAATDALSELTPSRREFTSSRIDEITDRVMSSPRCPPKYKRSGISTAVITVRGHCLVARAAPPRQVYYWFWRKQEP